MSRADLAQSIRLVSAALFEGLARARLDIRGAENAITAEIESAGGRVTRYGSYNARVRLAGVTSTSTAGVFQAANNWLLAARWKLAAAREGQ